MFSEEEMVLISSAKRHKHRSQLTAAMDKHVPSREDCPDAKCSCTLEEHNFEKAVFNQHDGRKVNAKRYRNRAVALFLAAVALAAAVHAVFTAVTPAAMSLLRSQLISPIGTRPNSGLSSETALFGLPDIIGKLPDVSGSVDPQILCPQEYERLPPSEYPELTEANVYGKLRNPEFVNTLAKHLSEAVQIATPSYDGKWDLPPSDPKAEDPVPHHKKFVELHDFLKKTYPTVHKLFEQWNVNRYSLVYRMNGTDPALKPIMLTSHLDVVPVDEKTLDRWTYPPFEGKIKDGVIWGRGTTDTKGTLVSIFDAIELLLTSDVVVGTHPDIEVKKWVPKRTIILAFGNDEESNSQGARVISKFLGETLGYNGDKIEVIVDEGESIMPLNSTFAFANVGIAEKGYLDVALNISSAGGHSSIPPKYTSIGYMARILSSLQDHPHVSPLIRSKFDEVPVNHPGLPSLMCDAAYDSPIISNKLKRIATAIALAPTDSLKRVGLATLGLAAQAESNRMLIWKLATTQAIDVINGGVKANALPEQVFASVNYRVDPFEEGVFWDSDKSSISTLEPRKDGEGEDDDDDKYSTVSLRKVEQRLVRKVILGELFKLSLEFKTKDWFNVSLKGVDDETFNPIDPEEVDRVFIDLWNEEKALNGGFIHKLNAPCRSSGSWSTCSDSISEIDAMINKPLLSSSSSIGGLAISGEMEQITKINLLVESHKFLVPSPVTATDDSSHYDILIGTVKHIFEKHSDDYDGTDPALHPQYESLVSVPALMAGNTDTARYWSLTKNIFRFSPLSSGKAEGAHTVDERVGVDDVAGAVLFFHEFIRNMDSLVQEEPAH